MEENSDGRSCENHAVCGREIKQNDLVKLKRMVLRINENLVPVIGVRKVRDAVESCIVGFVQTKADDLNVLHNKFAQVTEVYENSENTYKRKKSQRMRGMASVTLLDSVPEDE